MREAVEGLRAVAQSADLALIMVLAAVQSLTRGALTVFSVVVAIELLGTGEAGAGTLMTAVGVGAVLGSLAASLLVGTHRLGSWFAVGVALWGLPLVLVGLVPEPAFALVVLAFIGVGNALIDVAGFTLLARLAPDQVLARVFGVLESLVAVSTGIGAVVASAVIGGAGLRTALVVLGLLCPVAAVASWWRLRRLDRSVGVRDRDVALLQQVPMLRALPLPSIEQLARGLEPVDGARPTRSCSARATPGDRYFVIESRRGRTWSGTARSSRPSARARASARSRCCGVPAGPPRWSRAPSSGSRPCARTASSRSSSGTPRAPGRRRGGRRDAGPVLAGGLRQGGEGAMTSTRALLLIADMGGYTDYMRTHRMSLAHAEVNTGRLLERVIDAVPGFELVEIEGDAAFLSRPADGLDGEAAVTEVLRAAVAMHRAFHVERQYVARNLCPCAGCKEAGALTLKFVAHVGEVATQTIRDRRKLVGIDVILVHRLLKNPVALREYVVLSDDLHGGGAGAITEPVHDFTADLDGVGEVRAHYVDVDDLSLTLPPLPAPSWRGRVTRTFAAAGLGMPYLLGLRQPRRSA